MKPSLTPERKRLTHDEYDALIGLETVHAVLKSAKTWPALKDRLSKIKYGARDSAMITNGLGRIVKALYNDVPYEQLKTLSNNLHMSELHVGVKTTNKYSQKDYGMILSWEQLDELGRAAMEKCITCSLDSQQQRQCPLAKVLDQLPVHKDDSAKGCGYFGF